MKWHEGTLYQAHDTLRVMKPYHIKCWGYKSYALYLIVERTAGVLELYRNGTKVLRFQASEEEHQEIIMEYIKHKAEEME